MEYITTNLPVNNYRGDIEASVRGNSVTIITAETGAGKSTQVPQFLLDMGHRVLVTQPRRLAATSLAEYVAEIRGSKLGGEVGYRIGGDGIWSRDTRLFFVTDGLALVREFVGGNSVDVIVLDEVHEWTLNIEVLVAWFKKEIAGGRKIKLVLMSATIEADRLSKFFNNASVINVPGRLFPVEEVPPIAAGKVVHIIELVKAGHNVLVFEPGKAEIADTIQRLELARLGAVIMPLHGELQSAEQRRCFQNYDRSKIVVSTNVAQTSVTIPGITAVVDSGMERRVELVDHVEGLYIRAVSLADSKQRKGRAGRTQPGLYINYCTEENQLPFPLAEIERLLLDKTVLQLLSVGINPEELEFFHQPDKNKIHQAREMLQQLGCINKDGTLTSIGREVVRLPVSVRSGRMIVAAVQLGVLNDVVTIAAILEGGELQLRKDKFGLPTVAWRNLVCDEKTSDLLAQLVLFEAASRKTNKDMEAAGINPKAYYRIVQIRKNLVAALSNKISREKWSYGTNRESIITALVSGLVDKVYVRNYMSAYTNGDPIERRLHNDSVLIGPQVLVGIPRDFEIKTRFGGRRVMNVVAMATEVSAALLKKLAPHLVTSMPYPTPLFDATTQQVYMVTEVYLKGKKIGEERVVAPDSEEVRQVMRMGMFNLFLPNLPRFLPNRPMLRSGLLANLNEVPEVDEYCFATNSVTGEKFVAYGMYHNNWGQLSIKWFVSKDTALGARLALVDIVQLRKQGEAARVVARKFEEERHHKAVAEGGRAATMLDLGGLAETLRKTQGAAR